MTPAKLADGVPDGWLAATDDEVTVSIAVARDEAVVMRGAATCANRTIIRLAAELEAARSVNARLVALLTGGTYECTWKGQYSGADGDDCPGVRLRKGPCWNHRRLVLLAEIKAGA